MTRATDHRAYPLGTSKPLLETPTPECGLEHQEHYFVEELTFADADSILAMPHELCPHGVDGRLPVWVRNLAYRLVLLQRPDEPALMREAAENLARKCLSRLIVRSASLRRLYISSSKPAGRPPWPPRRRRLDRWSLGSGMVCLIWRPCG